MEPACASGFRSRWSISLSHQNFTNENATESPSRRGGHLVGFTQCVLDRPNWIVMELLIDEPHLASRGDGLSSFRLLASEHPENAREASYVFASTIRVV